MKRLIFVLALLVLVVLPAPAYASHASECGTDSWDGVGFMTKGRTDGMTYRADHTVGCARVVVVNLVGTGTDEAYGYPGQEANCQRYGKDDVVRTFKYRFHVTVSPDDVTVTCNRYVGSD